MKIYSDNDLPDVEMHWEDFTCDMGASTVEVTVASMDSDFTMTSTTACGDHVLTIANVPRERFEVTAHRLRPGSPLESTAYPTELDLRNGFDERVDLYFDEFANVHVTWAFANGATCDSLMVGSFDLEGRASEESQFSQRGYGSCFEGSSFGAFVPAGTYTFRLRARDWNTGMTVAMSPATNPTVVDENALTDLGTLELAPCGTSCPEP